MSPIHERPPMSLARRTLLAAAAAAPLFSTRARATGSAVVGTWGGDYAELLAANIDKPILAPAGIEVSQDVAPQDPRKAKLIAERTARRGSTDVCCLSDNDMYTMSLLNVFEPITASNVPALPHVIEQLRTLYAIPHIYSAKVILYNPNQIKVAPVSYADLWDPKYRGRVGFSDLLYSNIIESAALVGGGSMNNYEPGKAKLLELKALGAKVYPSNEALAGALKSEEVWLTIMWAARGFMWKKAGIPVERAVPREGATVYVSSAAVPKNAQHKDNGLAYLNAMLDPGAQAAFADRMGFLGTVDNARLPSDLLKEIGFTDREMADFRKLDFDYLAKNTSQLLDFWNKEFKA